MKFTYTAFDKAGQTTNGIVEANTLAEAREGLRGKGIFVTDLREGDESSANEPKARGGRIGTGQRLKNLAMFSRQLHVLIVSGTPIVQALNAIERQCEHLAWQAIVKDIRERVEEGRPLSEAMQKHPKHFDAVSRSLVAAGETSGNLPMMLDRLAVLSRKQLHLRSSIIGAMVYPCLLITIGINVLVLMLLFVLPRFSILFENLDSPLPPTTKFLLWVSAMLWSWWWALLILLVGAAAGIWFWINSEAGKHAFHTAVIRLPKLGRLAQNILSAKLSRMLGTLMESRVALVEALQLTRQSSTNIHYANLLQRAEDAVGRGEPMSAVLGNTDLISACVQEALRNGEHSGQIGAPLIQMADFLDEENDIVVKSLTSIIEPCILIALGLVVGFIAISMFLPMFDLVSAAHGGG